MGNLRESVLRLCSPPSVATTRGVITPSSLHYLWGMWPPLSGVGDSFLVPLVLVEHARVDVPTLYRALREVFRFAICTVSKPPSLVITQALVSGYRSSSSPGGPALSYCTLSFMFVLLGPRQTFPLPLPTPWILLNHTATPLLSWHLICLLGWHPTAPHDSCHLYSRVALLAWWLSSLSPSAPAIYYTVANPALGYAVSWYNTISLAHAKVRSVAHFPGTLPVTNACPVAG